MLTCEKIERQREFLFDLKMVDLKILKKIQKVLDRYGI